MTLNRRQFILNSALAMGSQLIPIGFGRGTVLVQDMLSSYHPPFENLMERACQQAGDQFLLQKTQLETDLTGDVVIAPASLLETHVKESILGGYLPGGLSTTQMDYFLRESGGLNVIRERFFHLGYDAHLVGYFSNVCGLWSRVDLSKVDSLEGLNCLGRGLSSAVFQHAGANVDHPPLIRSDGSVIFEKVDAFQWAGPDTSSYFPFHLHGFKYYLFADQPVPSGSAVLLLARRSIDISSLTKNLERGLRLLPLPSPHQYFPMNENLVENIRISNKKVADEWIFRLAGPKLSRIYSDLLS